MFKIDLLLDDFFFLKNDLDLISRIKKFILYVFIYFLRLLIYERYFGEIFLQAILKNYMLIEKNCIVVLFFY